MTSVRNLGRGLSALLGEVADDSEIKNTDLPIQTLKTEQIKPGIMQPRKVFNNEKLEALASSIIQKGVLQPLLVRKTSDQIYEIVAGERRWRASQMAGLQTLPVVVVDYDDQEALEIGLIENLQRDDLNPIEEAESLQKLIQKYDRTQEEVASLIGKSRSYVTNTLRLLHLSDFIKNLIQDGKLTAGHARALVNQENADELAKKIVEDGLNVRSVEALKKTKRQGTKEVFYEQNPDIHLIEEKFNQLLSLPCKLKIREKKGELKIIFENLEEMDNLLSKLENKQHL